jgi:parvulin-like peptidyl-prolyl isomerase
MRRLLYLITIIFNFTIAKAELPNIVALVNNQPITSCEFLARKHMIMVLNNIQYPDYQKNKQLDKVTIQSLIDESLLYQSVKNKEISDKELNEAIDSIEQRNKMPKGELIEFLKSKSVDINSFKSQIGAEIIKMNILSSFSRSVAVSPKEVNAIILSSNEKDAQISAQIFTSKDKQGKTLAKMYSLQKSLKNCRNVKKSLYKDFATIEEIDKNLSSLDPKLQIFIKDLSIDQKSSIFETQDGFKLILICDKKIINLTNDENSYLLNLLTNKKMSQKAQKFFDDMHKKAYIKIMLPS